MFKEAGSGLQVCCDDKAQLLRVATNTPLLSGLKGTWRELATFTSEDEWLESPYSKQITDESVLDMIDWFWMDLENILNQKKKRFTCRWCKEVFESEFGAFCSHCCRFQTNTMHPDPPEPLNDE